MLENGRITYKQLILLMFMFREAVNLTYFPLLTAPPGNQDLWISVLLSFPLQLLLTAPIYFLWTYFPNKTIIQYSQLIAGKAGKIIGLLYIWFFIHISAIIVAQFGYFMTIAIMPETPILFFLISLILVCAYAVWNGLEVIGRITEIFVPVTLATAIIFVIFMLKNMDLKGLLPIMENGFLPVLYGGLTTAGRSVEILIFAMIFPYLNSSQKARNAVIFSFLLINVNVLLITIPIITIFGVADAKIRLFPFVDAIKLVNIGDFFERIETFHYFF